MSIDEDLNTLLRQVQDHLKRYPVSVKVSGLTSLEWDHRRGHLMVTWTEKRWSSDSDGDQVPYNSKVCKPILEAPLDRRLEAIKGCFPALIAELETGEQALANQVKEAESELRSWLKKAMEG